MIPTSTNSITCPKCGQVIPLQEAMERQMQSGLDEKLKDERQRMQQEALKITKQAEDNLRIEFQQREQRAMADADQRIREMESANKKIKEDAERMKANNESVLAQKMRELDIKETQLKADANKLQQENESKLAEVRQRVEEETRKRIEDDNTLKQAQDTIVMGQLKNEIEALRRKAESTSQQLIGESQEIALEDALRMAFPSDLIEPVGKGLKGADCIQKIRTNGDVLGMIVWESKRTKQWLNEWIPKLKDDQRTLNAELAILVTQTMPNGFPTKAGLNDGVWITDFPTAISVAMALRSGLIYASSMKALSNGSDEKSQKLFEYITSQDFRGNIQTIIETFIALEADLAARERAFVKQCKKERMTYQRVLTATNRIYGSLQITLGEKSMPEIEVHEQKQLE
jgi:hypothetical protein